LKSFKAFSWNYRIIELQI